MIMLSTRSYKPEDYPQIASLYKQSELYGGQFDENRDSGERLSRKIKDDPEAILVCELDGKIVGTVSIIEDGRVAWLVRFAVTQNGSTSEIATLLYDKAVEILKARGHNQVLVYAPANKVDFVKRYAGLGFEKGSDYTCFWKDI